MNELLGAKRRAADSANHPNTAEAQAQPKSVSQMDSFGNHCRVKNIAAWAVARNNSRATSHLVLRDRMTPSWVRHVISSPAEEQTRTSHDMKAIKCAEATHADHVLHSPETSASATARTMAAVPRSAPGPATSVTSFRNVPIGA